MHDPADQQLAVALILICASALFFALWQHSMLAGVWWLTVVLIYFKTTVPEP